MHFKMKFEKFRYIFPLERDFFCFLPILKCGVCVYVNKMHLKMFTLTPSHLTVFFQEPEKITGEQALLCNPKMSGMFENLQ